MVDHIQKSSFRRKKHYLKQFPYNYTLTALANKIEITMTSASYEIPINLILNMIAFDPLPSIQFNNFRARMVYQSISDVNLKKSS